MKNSIIIKTLIGLAALVALGGCAAQDVSSNPGLLSWEEFRGSAFQEPETGVFIVNGDEAIPDEVRLREFYDRMVAHHLDQDNVGSYAQYLIVNQSGSSDDVWDASTAMNLTYCVSTSFGSDYTTMVNAMARAASNWEGTGANIHFVHDASLDSNCNARTSGVVFDVNPTSSTQYVARAFFPSTGRRQRNVLFSTYYLRPGTLGVWSIEGVLTHELGHALGFRHEHTRPEAGTCYEDSNWRALTSYDSSSVMHYPHCNGTQSGDLRITTDDRAGAAALYSGDGGGGGGGGGGTCDLGARGDSCSTGADCCSGRCKGNGTCG